MFNLKNVKKVYKNGSIQTTALNNINLDFPDKGLVVLLGKSGCGKSTLLNILGGLDKPTSGQVVVDGKDMVQLKGANLDSFRNTYIGYVFQEFNLIDELSVFDNIEMTLRIQEKRSDYMSVDDALAMVGLNNLGHRKPTELSGGQRQRVAIARALIKNSEVLLADELTGSLDYATGLEVFETLKKISKEKLVIVVTHDSEMAYTYASRVVELSDGQIIKDVTNRSKAQKSIRKLSKQVIEISQGEKLSLQMINESLNNEDVNYIGINYDLDRITLAYPEILDTINTLKEDVDYTKTQKEDISKKEPNFRLKKGKLPMKYALGLAKKSITLRKKRFRMLTAVASFGFTFTLFAFIMGLFATRSVLNNVFWNDQATPIVTVRHSGWNNDYITQENMTQITRAMGIQNVGVRQNLNLVPESPSTPSDNRFSFNGFTSAIVGASLNDLSLNLIHGSTLTNDENSLIISDFAAFHILRNGFIGYNQDGEYAIHFLNNMQSLIGSRLLMQNGEYHEITGIFQTNFNEFQEIRHFGEHLTRSQQRKYDIFWINKDQLYQAIIKPNVSSEDFDQVNLDMFSWDSLISSDNSASSSHNEISNFFSSSEIVFSDFDNTSVSFINTPAQNELIGNQGIISMGLLEQLWDLGHIAPGIDRENFVRGALQNNIQVILQLTEWNRTSINIVNVINSSEIIFLTSDLMASQIMSQSLATEVVVGRGNQSNFVSRVNTLSNLGFDFGSSLMNPTDLGWTLQGIDTTVITFLVMGLVFLGVSFLIALNFMVMTVRIRKKEILVYKVLGTKNRDLAKIFAAEGLYISLRTTIIASIGVWVITYFFNLSFSNIDAVINFHFWYIPLFFILITTFMLIAIAIPVRTILSKKPAEAMKLF